MSLSVNNTVRKVAICRALILLGVRPDKQKFLHWDSSQWVESARWVSVCPVGVFPMGVSARYFYFSLCHSMGFVHSLTAQSFPLHLLLLLLGKECLNLYRWIRFLLKLSKKRKRLQHESCEEAPF